MSLLTHLFSYTLQNSKSLVGSTTSNLACIRLASKKASGCTRNKPDNLRPKHRGWRVQDGTFVKKSTILATQLRPRFHPGLYVGMAKDGTLYALEAGKVLVTCEKINPNSKHGWSIINYAGKENTTIYKKYFNVIPEPQHDRFIVVDTV